MTVLEYIFSPIKIGAMEAKNSLVMRPMGINLGVDEEGNVTDSYFPQKMGFDPFQKGLRLKTRGPYLLC